MNIENAKLVTHKGCADGSGCAIVFIAAGGKRENITFVGPDHNEVDDVAKDLMWTHDGLVIFADVSLSKEMALKLVGKDNIVLLDHHKSAMELQGISFCYIDNSKCGTKLLYEWILKNNSPELSENYRHKFKHFVDCIDDKDRWVNAIEDSFYTHTLHHIYGQELFIERFLRNPAVLLTENEKFSYELDKRKEADYIKQKKGEIHTHIREFQGRTVRIGFINAGGPYRSKLGDEVCNDPALDLDALIMVNGDYISMRSRRGFDVSELAKLNGGGGHLAAAGCQLSGILGKNIIELVIENMKFES